MSSYSDSDSIFSVDSLEGENSAKLKADLRDNNGMKEHFSIKDVAVPYYKQEISVEEATENLDSKPSRVNVLYKNLKRHSKSQTEQTNINPANQSTSYFWNGTDLNQQVAGQRLSRRKQIIKENKNLLRSRHRSVSYLDQFRKKMYGAKTNLDDSNYSTAGSILSDRDQSLSFLSCLSSESRMSSSEFDFYDELIKNQNNEQLPWTNESLQSSTLLTDITSKCTESNKSTKQSKEKTIVLSKISAVKLDQQKKELEKKSAIERRDIYANKVKLRNTMKINRQKERDKINRFPDSSFHLKNCMEECFLQSQINYAHNAMSYGKTSADYSQTVTKEANQVQNLKNNRKIQKNEHFQKTQRRHNHQRHNKKEKKSSDLFNLQERHEREKSLIESMRNMILKT